MTLLALLLALNSSTTPQHSPKASSCPVPNRNARVLNQARPENGVTFIPSGDLVEVRVLVTISPGGALESARIEHSSGNGAIDREALRVARTSTYSPAMRECKPVTGSYLLRLDLTTAYRALMLGIRDGDSFVGTLK